jgi:hypothetical protein
MMSRIVIVIKKDAVASEYQKRRMPSSGMLISVPAIRKDVSEEPSPTIISATRIGDLGTTLAVTGNRCTLRSNGVTCQETAFFIITAVKTPNLT